ncbi:RNA polymerase sigma factor [Cohnella silvisoli]|uniref:RNA polymerase sigma factor n=1 Tax=Cohnella silvisoli TaxID=2873699 RepID=A0ABV1KTP6_9BACL|nr:RNA polymerase sigma factor [Cohnella silvisoli]MCD9022632.1 RNA polymerase sigma factor [Cohnella silvisoli]
MVIEVYVDANKNDNVEVSSDADDPLEWTREEQLVEKARAGDREAFGELVRHHRAKALGWAVSISRDTEVAEDIVQDALVRAFLHVGTISDVFRFRSWFRRIVQNQANYRLRRGGPYGKERPFTSMEEGTTSTDSSSWGDTDWFDIDSILFHFSKSLKARQSDENPEARIVRLEFIQGIRSLLGCLSKHERGVFEAHFFRQLPPSEIASVLGTTTANVYTLLSRSRSKVRKERIQIYFKDVAAAMVRDGQPTRRILARPFEI